MTENFDCPHCAQDLRLAPDAWDELLRLRQRVEGLEDELEKIAQWSDAYPLSVFPEPDFEKAAQVLKDAGLTLDGISASNMRHVVEGVGKIAKEALAEETT